MGRYLDMAAEVLRGNPPLPRKLSRNHGGEESPTNSLGYDQSDKVLAYNAYIHTHAREQETLASGEYAISEYAENAETSSPKPESQQTQSDNPLSESRGNLRGNPAGLRGNAQAPEAADPPPDWWADEFEERAAIRGHEGGYTRIQAERLAWGELENRWHRLHGERVPPELCAGCRRSIGNAPAMEQIDGNRVHDAPGHDCLIHYGERWRNRARTALAGMGLSPPDEQDGSP